VSRSGSGEKWERRNRAPNLGAKEEKKRKLNTRAPCTSVYRRKKRREPGDGRGGRNFKLQRESGSYYNNQRGRTRRTKKTHRNNGQERPPSKKNNTEVEKKKRGKKCPPFTKGKKKRGFVPVRAVVDQGVPSLGRGGSTKKKKGAIEGGTAWGKKD